MKSIKLKLIICFASVVLIVALGGVVMFLKTDQAADHARDFVTRNWYTADLIMETRIALDDVARQVMLPAAEIDPETLAEQLRQSLLEVESRYADASLAPEDKAKVVALLQRVRDALPHPIRLATRPGEEMEIADAAVVPIMEQIRILRDVDLANTLWEGVMAFNDILITGDPKEQKVFTARLQQVESHPQFHRLQPAYGDFKQKALAVFSAADDLAQARQEFVTVQAELSQRLRALENQYEDEILNPAASSLLDELQVIGLLLLTTLAGSALLALLVAYGLAMGFSSPVQAMRAALGRMARGELRQSLGIRRQDEFGQMARAVEDMGGNLCRLVGRISTAAGELTQIAATLQQASGELTGMADGQTQQLRATSEATRQIGQSSGQIFASVERLQQGMLDSVSSLAQMSNNIGSLAENSAELGMASAAVSEAIASLNASIGEVVGRSDKLKRAADRGIESLGLLAAANLRVDERARVTLGIAETVNTDATHGQRAVQSTIAGIDAIGQASTQAAAVIQSLEQKTQRINQVLAVIEGLADQVDLLSLNAAIIAAQAGEHGQGFAVVAKEIKDLSTQTSASTRSISQVIEDLLQETARAVAAITDAQQAVASGTLLSQESGEALGKIVEGAQEVSLQMQQVVASTRRQAEENQHMRDTMEGMMVMIDEIVEQTHSQQQNSRSVAAAAENMRVGVAEVSQATNEQSAASRRLARSAEEIEQMIDSIRSGCAAQNQTCQQIVAAMDQLEKIVLQGQQQALKLDGSAGRLGGQVDDLRQEIGQFKID